MNAAVTKLRLVQIAEEIISLLASNPQATVNVSLEISAHFSTSRSGLPWSITAHNWRSCCHKPVIEAAAGLASSSSRAIRFLSASRL